jgi:hypothetical protein
MKKKLQLPLIISFILIAMSCKKENEYETINPCLPYNSPTIRIKEIVTIRNGQTWKSIYKYDSLDRIKKRIDSGEYANVVNWKYEKDRVLLNSNVIIFNLNSKGLAANSSIYSWEYDSLGYLIKEIIKPPDLGIEIHEYTYECWNRNIEIGSYQQIGGELVIGKPAKYEYYYDKINTIGLENEGIAYFGKQDNCLIKYVLTSPRPQIDTLFAYSYEFDSLNRVSSETMKNPTGVIQIRKFKYFDGK